MKKIIYLLIVALLLPTISSFTIFADEAIDERIRVVSDIGIITGDEANDLRLNNVLTRAETAAIVYRLKNPRAEGDIRASRQIFRDVDINHWAAGEIEFLYDINIVSGDENAMFRPNDGVSAAEFYKMLLYVAGYGNQLENNGAYPNNVMQTATKTYLNKNLTLSFDKKLVRKEAFLILYNLLQTDTLILESYKGGRPIYKNGGKFISTVLDISIDKGVITGACGVSSSGEKIPDDIVEIDGKPFTNKAKINVDMIGRRVKYYHKEESFGDDIVLCAVSLSDDAMEINSGDIISYSDNEYIYDTPSGRKRAELSPKKDIYYNGHTVLGEFHTVSVPQTDADGNPIIDNLTGNQIIDKSEKSYMIPQYGKVKLFDSDGDKKYDTVMVEDYQNVLCDYINNSSMTIYGTSNGEKVNIELGDLDEYLIQDVDGKTVSLRSITKDTLVMIQYYNNKKGLIITVCDNTLDGDITSVNYEESFVSLNGKDYKIATSNANNKSDFKLQSNAVLYFDIYGNVGGVTYSDSKWEYGFVVKVICAEDGETKEFTIVNSSGEVADYPCSKKMRIDGIKTDNSLVKSAVSSGSVIRYFINSEKQISMIDTASSKPITEWDGSYNEDNTLLERVKRTEKTMCKTTNRAFYSNNMTVFYDDNTVFLRVPSEPEESGYTRYDNFKTLKTTNLVHKGIYTMAAYNTDPNNLIADYIVIYDDEKEIAAGSHFMLVDKVNVVLDENDEITYQLKGLYDGQVVKYNLEEPSLVNIGSHKIQSGDILKIRLLSNVITNVELIYSTYDPSCKESRLGPDKNTTTSTSYNAAEKFEFGWVERVQYPNIVIKRNTSSDSEFPYSFYNCVDTFFIYIYDVNKKKSQISMGTIYDIKSRERYFDKYDTVVAGVESTNGQTLILIRSDENN